MRIIGSIHLDLSFNRNVHSSVGKYFVESINRTTNSPQSSRKSSQLSQFDVSLPLLWRSPECVLEYFATLAISSYMYKYSFWRIHASAKPSPNAIATFCLLFYIACSLLFCFSIVFAFAFSSFALKTIFIQKKKEKKKTKLPAKCAKFIASLPTADITSQVCELVVCQCFICCCYFFFVYNLKIILPFRLSTDIWCLYWLRKHSHSFTYMYDATSAVCFERYVIFSNRIELWLVKKYRTIKYFHWKPKETHVSHSIACLLADWLFAVSCPVVGSGLCGTRSILTKINK